MAERFDELFLLRPTLIFPLWIMVLAGHRLAAPQQHLKPLRWLLVATALTTLFGLVYLLNQMRDRDGDRQNSKSALVACDLVSRRAQWIVALLLGVIAPAALVASGFGHLGLWMVALFGVSGLLYNFTPLALEARPWGGVLSGALGGWMLLRVGEALAGGKALLLAEAPYVAAFTAGCLLTGLPDIAGDRLTGKRTFAVAYGQWTTVFTSGAMIVVAGLLGLWRGDWVIVPPAAVGMLLILWALAQRQAEWSVVANKAAIFLLALGVGIHYPPFLAAIALYLPLARWYHRARFGLDYPSFRAG